MSGRPTPPRRVWTPLGTDNATNPSLSTSTTSIRDNIFKPGFIDSLDQQVSLITFIQNSRAHLSEPALHQLVAETTQQLSHIPIARFLAILELKDPIEVRDALARTYIEPRPHEADEDLYPKRGWLGLHLKHARESKAPIAYHFWTGVAVLAAACRRNIYMNLGYRLYPNHYFFIIGDSGLGKSAAFRHIEPLIPLANSYFIDEAYTYECPVLGGASPPDRRIHLLERDLNMEWIIHSMTPAPFPMDPRPEFPNHASHLMPDSSVGFLINDELILTGSKHKYGAAGVFHLLTALYNCPDGPWLGKGTIARGQQGLLNPTFNFLYGSTTEWINLSVSEDMFAGGFLSRCGFCYRTDLGFTPRKKDPPLDPVLKHTLARTLVPWYLLHPAREVVFAPEAERLWYDLIDRKEAQMRSTKDLRMRPYYERKHNHVGKLAMTLLASALVDDPPSFSIEALQARPSLLLTEETLAQAIRIIEHEEQFLPECFAHIGEHYDSARMDRILEFVRRHEEETGTGPTKAVLYRRAKEIFGRDAQRIIDQITAAQLLTTEVGTKPPRGPTPIHYRTNG